MERKSEATKSMVQKLLAQQKRLRELYNELTVVKSTRLSDEKKVGAESHIERCKKELTTYNAVFLCFFFPDHYIVQVGMLITG